MADHSVVAILPPAESREIVLNRFHTQLAGKWDDYAGPRTVSDPTDQKKKRFGAYLYAKKIMIREVQEEPDDQTKHCVRCCHCRKSWKDRNPADTSTSLFIRHVQDEHHRVPATAAEYEKQLSELQYTDTYSSSDGSKTQSNKRPRIEPNPWTQSIGSSAARRIGENFDDQVFREMVVKFLVESNSPFSLVESSTFQQLLRYCNAKCPNLSRRTTIRDLRALHNKLRPQLQAGINYHIASGGRINITLDAWTAGNKLPYLGITAYWLDSSFQLHDIVLDFVRLYGSHTGENLANVVKNTLESYGIISSLGCITADNATVNWKMCQVLEHLLPEWKRGDGFVRCMAHVINLAAQMIIWEFKAEAIETEADMADDNDWTNELSPGAVLRKVRRIVSKLRASTKLWESLVLEAGVEGLKCLRPILDMRIRYLQL